MSLAVRAQDEELMDAADLDPATYADVLADLTRVNRVTLAWRPTLSFLDRLRAPRLRVLDVGYGQGDMLRAIARWAERRNVSVELVGIDLNRNSAAVARAATPSALGIDYRTGDYQALAGEDWDVVVSSLVAHHMTRDQLIAFLRFMEAEARMGWLINDLHRHRFAALGWPALATLLRWHPIVRHDGALSIRRSYRPEEWPPLLSAANVADAEIRAVFPFRLCVERRR